MSCVLKINVSKGGCSESLYHAGSVKTNWDEIARRIGLDDERTIRIEYKSASSDVFVLEDPDGIAQEQLTQFRQETFGMPAASMEAHVLV